MGTITINKLIGKSIKITTGGGSSEPTAKRETVFYFADGTSEEYLIEGTLSQSWMINKGYYDSDNYDWNKTIINAEIGAAVTSIGDSVFLDCGRLTTVTIPQSVTSIETGAFGYCGLTSMTIPEGVTNIDMNAFQNCVKLKSVTIPSTVTRIGMNAFQNCFDLTSVTISQGVTSIGESAFEGCSSLRSLTIPSSVTSIESYAFYQCDNLTIHVPNQAIKTLVENSEFDGSIVID